MGVTRRTLIQNLENNPMQRKAAGRHRDTEAGHFICQNNEVYLMTKRTSGSVSPLCKSGEYRRMARRLPGPAAMERGRKIGRRAGAALEQGDVVDRKNAAVQHGEARDRRNDFA